MIDFKYLSLGLNGLANAHQAGTMAGHLGAAVAAGYFIGEDQSELPAQVYEGIASELDRVMQGEEAIWFNAKKAGVTPQQLFRKLPAAAADADAIPKIAEALRENIAETRQSGHNVIFASIALRALHDHHDFATAPAIEGVCNLIRGFNHAHAGRGYYGKEKGWLTGNQVKLDPDDSFPIYKDLGVMAETTIAEMIRGAAVRKQGFGGWWHLINHAAALTELHRFGYADLARKGLAAHHQHLSLYRSLPDVEAELGKVVPSEHDPRTAVYWEGMLKRDEARLTHRIKTLYGFYTLLRFIEDEKVRKQAEAKFLYLIA